VDTLTLALITLRASALVLDASGRKREGGYLLRLAELAEGGRNVDEHMKAVAQALKTGAPKDWQGAIDRLEKDSARLQAGAEDTSP